MTTTRTVFHNQVREALDQAEPAVATIWGDHVPTLEIVRRDSVRTIVSTWPDTQLNWEYAVKKCQRFPRSCFIGVQTQDGAVPILALIRVSDAHLHTNLLFLEKDANAVPSGIAMTVMDTVLEVVAGAFGSERIVLDNPLSVLASYYKEFGYESMRKRGREAPAMFKSAGVQ
jgi:hypothetical protein